jgi:hypothetical protein
MQGLSQQAAAAGEPYTATAEVKSCHLRFSFPNYTGPARLLGNSSPRDIPGPISDSDQRWSNFKTFAPTGAGRHPFGEVSL